MRRKGIEVLRVAAVLLGGLAVAAGAFGAHSLRESLEPSDLDVFQTAVRYQMWHALALLTLSMAFTPTRRLVAAGFLMLVGTILFSGSLYALALGGPSWVGPITPTGGAALIAGWLLLALAHIPRERRRHLRR